MYFCGMSISIHYPTDKSPNISEMATLGDGTTFPFSMFSSCSSLFLDLEQSQVCPLENSPAPPAPAPDRSGGHLVWGTPEGVIREPTHQDGTNLGAEFNASELVACSCLWGLLQAVWFLLLVVAGWLVSGWCLVAAWLFHWHQLFFRCSSTGRNLGDSWSTQNTQLSDPMIWAGHQAIPVYRFYYFSTDQSA